MDELATESVNRQGEVLAFGPFTLVPRERLLTKDGVRVDLGGRALDLLLQLVARPGEPIGKPSLLAAVWPDQTVGEGSLRLHMTNLRKAIGDGRGGARYIATLSGRGYCFVADVRRAPAEALAPPGDTLVTNLSLAMHPIVERERELAELADCLRQYRLVTLLGSGGVGKTRLAVELGRRRLADYPDGVWLVDLAPLSDPDLVLSAIATVLDLPPDLEPGALAQRLASRRMLLIFDNCEHLIDAVGSLAEILVSRASALSLLATSQQSLRVGGEYVYRLEPLALAPAGDVDPARYGAVALFIELARRADRSFALSAQNADAVAEICRRLDGVPLALEMAAARLEMLGVDGLLAGLTERLSLLKAEAASADRRHESLRQLAGWSYRLLSEIDQAAFRRLSVFRGSFSLDGGVEIMDPAGLDRWETLDVLCRLREKSLLALESGPTPRYRLLETLRLYALEQLQARGESDDVAEQHAHSLAALATRAQVAWETTPDAEWITLYRPEIDNVRAALDGALSAPERRQVALELAAPSLHLLDRLALLAESRRYAGRLASLLDDQTPAETAAGLLLQMAACWRAAHSPLSERYLEQAAALYRELEDSFKLATTLTLQADFHRRQRRYAKAEVCAAEARVISAASRSKLEVAIQIQLGALANDRADYVSAREHITAGLALSRELRSSLQELACLSNLGALEYRLGNLERAVDRGRETVALARSRPVGSYLSASLANLAAYQLAQGRADEARPLMEEAWARLGENEFALATNLQICAVLAAFEGRLKEAALLIGFVDAEWARWGMQPSLSEMRLYDELARRLETGLGADELLALKAEAAHWSEAGAIRFADAQLFRPDEQGGRPRR